MEGQEKDVGKQLVTTAHLSVSGEIVVGVDAVTHEVGVRSFSCVCNLRDGGLHCGELNECEKGTWKIGVVLVEDVELITWPQEGKKFHADDGVYKEGD